MQSSKPITYKPTSLSTPGKVQAASYCFRALVKDTSSKKSVSALMALPYIDVREHPYELLGHHDE
jgi:hypothetical protein